MTTEEPFVSNYSNVENKRYEIQPLAEYDKEEEKEYLAKKSNVDIEDERETVSSKENDDCDAKKKRNNARKRNRSDMSPEELRKLREREIKAQQSRRDRIRAQKVIYYFISLFFNSLNYNFTLISCVQF